MQAAATAGCSITGISRNEVRAYHLFTGDMMPAGLGNFYPVRKQVFTFDNSSVLILISLSLK